MINKKSEIWQSSENREEICQKIGQQSIKNWRKIDWIFCCSRPFVICPLKPENWMKTKLIYPQKWREIHDELDTFNEKLVSDQRGKFKRFHLETIERNWVWKSAKKSAELLQFQRAEK